MIQLLFSGTAQSPHRSTRRRSALLAPPRSRAILSEERQLARKRAHAAACVDLASMPEAEGDRGPSRRLGGLRVWSESYKALCVEVKKACADLAVAIMVEGVVVGKQPWRGQEARRPVVEASSPLAASSPSNSSRAAHETTSRMQAASVYGMRDSAVAVEEEGADPPALLSTLENHDGESHDGWRPLLLRRRRPASCCRRDAPQSA